ncbi:MAG: hypothetical protein KTR28_03070 [Micavibrio sp.]|nr:hypothetical protein [Micavibrio sp.]
MPREEKRIFFSGSEAYKALYSLCKKRDLRVPPTGTIKKLTHNKNEKKIAFVIEGAEQKLVKIDYGEDFLAAALLLFCMGSGIPVSKRAKKLVFVDGDEVVLKCEQ